jgi:dihydropteroate synthase
MRPVFTWNIGSRSLELGKRTVVMGVVNVTPDSFSDGGQHFSPEAALAHALKLIEEGAEIVDVGGESTRPGARAGTDSAVVAADEELRRVLPVIAGIKKAKSAAIVSVDTYKATVARAAVEVGAEIVNDVSGLLWDPDMRKTVAGMRCGVVIMHTRGRPEEWKSLPSLPDAVMLVKKELRERADETVRAGIPRGRITLDPGFGFGKGYTGDYALLREFDKLHELRFPLLAGVSRKSFIGKALGRDGTEPPASERLFGTLGAETALVLKGAHIIRTHDVQACVEALKVADLVA